MKNKGFTLVELIGVIVILGLIATIGVPSVIKTINKVRMNAAARSFEGYVKAMNLAQADYESENGKYANTYTKLDINADNQSKFSNQIVKFDSSEGYVVHAESDVDKYFCVYNVSVGSYCYKIDVKNVTLASPYGLAEYNKKLSKILEKYSISYYCDRYNLCTDEENNATIYQPYLDEKSTLSYYWDNYMGVSLDEYYIEDVKRVIFKNDGKPIKNAIAEYNVASDGSDLYKLYIATNENDSSYTDWYFVSKINFVLNEDSADLFSGFSSLTELVNLDIVDTSKVTNMSYLFSNCINLEKVDLRNFNTSNVTNMESMFCYCISLQELDVSSFDTSKVTDMTSMFEYVKSIPSLDLSNFDTSNVESMYSLFDRCGYYDTLFTLTLGDNFITSKVVTMKSMFNCCGFHSTVFTLDLGNNFYTNNVVNMSLMFSECGYNNSIFTLNLGSNFNTSNVTDMSYMFRYCGYYNSNFTLNLGSNFNTSNVTNMSYMFCNCGYYNKSFTLDLSGFNTSNVTNMSQMFYGDNYLKNIYVGNGWDVDQVTSSATMFYGCFNLPNTGNRTAMCVDSDVTDKTHADISATGYLTLKTA